MTTDDTTSPAQQPAGDENLVPAWLALLVLILIIAVVGVGGFVVRGMMTGRPTNSTKQADIEQWTKAVDAAPDDATARLNLAYAYQQDTQYDRALAEYDKVLAQEPKDTAALYNKGVILMITGEAKKGEAALWAVLKIDSGHALAAKELGEYYAAKGQFKSLIVAVRPVVEAKPTLADLQYLMGLAYEKTGKPDWAKERYDLALKYSPDMQEAIDGLRRLGEVAK
ncbi:MAG: tetratricopeptide repeat protein [Coriobacteriia bacterium]|nr:tetratricopeptide repeat protein [Coriobacteriia bacterium]